MFLALTGLLVPTVTSASKNQCRHSRFRVPSTFGAIYLRSKVCFVRTSVFPVDEILLWYPVLANNKIDAAIYIHTYLFAIFVSLSSRSLLAPNNTTPSDHWVKMSEPRRSLSAWGPSVRCERRRLPRHSVPAPPALVLVQCWC
jgi:hypothetical protein